MNSWFRKKQSIPNTIKLSINGVNPNTDNQFLFFNFVQFEPVTFLKEWYYQLKSQGVYFKEEYESAINQKIKNGEFRNPFTFPDYFDCEFDYIAIDFETANTSRLSACAIGLTYIKNSREVYSTSHYIKPPSGEEFTSRHTAIHGITSSDVEYSLTFYELWKAEFSRYFNNNLIVFHNTSMDLSVLKALFSYYKIRDYDILYIDTMKLATKAGYQKKLSELAMIFDINFNTQHDPREDSRVCAYVYAELMDKFPAYEKLFGKLKFEESQNESDDPSRFIEIQNQNIEYVKKYSLSGSKVNEIEIKDKAFIFTGDLSIDRFDAQEFIIKNGGIVKTGISKNVNFVVVGPNYGWAKIQKIHMLNSEKNCSIKILTESDFKTLLSKYAT